jgi:methyl acetate hydrolase
MGFTPDRHSQRSHHLLVRARALRGIKESMSTLNRREFAAAIAGLTAQTKSLWGATGIDETIRSGLKQRNIPAAVAMVANADKTTFVGAYGQRDSASGVDVTAGSIFRIASMTKAVTSAAALQLVEQGKLTFDQPVAKHLPQLGKLEILEGFDQDKPILRAATEPVTLRHLLTHTSGFAYDVWDANMLKYTAQSSPSTDEAPAVTPLMFEPGARWEYGTSLDWTGRLVEAVSGLTLEQYFERNILSPLGMKDTGFSVPNDKFDRLVSGYQRQSDGSLKENPRTLPAPPKFFNGGGGLYSTAGDYVRFTQMILRRGRSSGGDQILRPKTVDLMTTNQIGDLSAGKMKSVRPSVSSDVDFHPGFTDKFGFGFLINTTAHEGGRSANSLAWAGLANTFYWIDPRRRLCAVLMMQFLPFVDVEAVGMLHDFEKAVYRIPSRE